MATLRTQKGTNSQFQGTKSAVLGTRGESADVGKKLAFRQKKNFGYGLYAGNYHYSFSKKNLPDTGKTSIEQIQKTTMKKVSSSILTLLLNQKQHNISHAASQNQIFNPKRNEHASVGNEMPVSGNETVEMKNEE